MIDIRYNPTTKTLEIHGMTSPEPEHYTGDYDGIFDGFYYNGIHSSEYHVSYIPDASDLWFAGTEYDVYDNDVAWRSGGYYYGNAAQKHVFQLKCFYEEITIEQREKIRKWLHRNTSGKLILDDMPFVYWNVRPTKRVDGQEYIDCGRYSGTFTLELTAYDPFGYLTRKSNSASDDDGAEQYCGIIDSSMMPAAPGTSTRNFMVYNPGTENCGMMIKLAGTASKPIRFFNNTNGTMCVISALPTGGVILDLNGDTGLVKVYTSANPSNYSNGFAYHDYGMVRLDPNETYTDVMYTAVQNGTTYTIAPSQFDVKEDMVGGYIQFDDPTTRNATITAVNTTNNTLTCTLGGSGTFKTSGKMRISTMNNISIQEKNDSGNWVTPTGLTLTSIAIDYNPRLL